MPRHRSLVVVAVLAVHAIAEAAPDPHRALQEAMHTHAGLLADIRVHLADAPTGGRDDLTCELALRSARLANVPDDHALTSERFAPLAQSYRDAGGVHLRVGDAQSLCAELRRWGVLARAHAAVRTAARTPTDDSEYADVIARTCRADVASALAEGFAAQTLFYFDNRAVRLGDARAVCDALAVRRAAPYAALGVTGDRLRYLTELHGKTLYGLGGIELPTPAARKRASVLFELQSAAGTWLVYRTELEGDRIVRESTLAFDKAPARAAFR